MTGYGPNKGEKWELGYYLLCISVGSILTALSLTLPVSGVLLLILPGLWMMTLGTLLTFNWAQRLSLRIRIEESQEKQELIDKIIAIYRGND